MTTVVKAHANVARGGKSNASDAAYDALEAARKRYDEIDRQIDEFTTPRNSFLNSAP
jgi:hypothetical protein